ncbi:MAG: TRAP transporter large permease subunit [Desulfobacterales bacterium]|nr:TRAP transporter large permease subunit [Desulfobacterales bacterium]
MALVGFAGFAYLNGFKAAMTSCGGDLFEAFTNYGYTVFPLFMLMGQIGLNAGIAQRLYDSANKFIGHIPGGLAMATVLGAAGFKAICGSSTATAATFASVAIPEMNRYNYDKRLSTGIVATVGTLGCMVPPSVTLILYGIITEQSIGKLFLAGIIPGTAHRALFHGHHLRMGKNRSEDRPPVGAIHLEGPCPHIARDHVGPDRFLHGGRRDHGGLLHPSEGGGCRHICAAGPGRSSDGT